MIDLISENAFVNIETQTRKKKIMKSFDTVAFPLETTYPEELRTLCQTRVLSQYLNNQIKEQENDLPKIKPDDIKNSNVARLLRAVLGYSNPRPLRFGRL